MSGRVTAYAVATLLWAAGADVAHAECPPPDEARIFVTVSFEPVETSFDVSLAELERLAVAAGREAHMPLMAVYSSSVVFSLRIQTRAKRIAAHRSCGAAKSIDVDIVVRKRTIHAARELRDMPCLLKAATDHAAAHARYQEDSLSAARETIASNLSARLRASSPAARSATEAEREISRIVSAQIDADLASIDADKAVAARAIDSPEALEKLKAACPNEQAGFVNERT